MVARRAVVGGLALLVLILVLAGAAALAGIIGSAGGPSPAASGGASASEDPHALSVANVTRSVLANAGFAPLATLDNLQVTIPPGADEVDLDVRPNLVLDERAFLLQAGSDALVAARAIIGWFPTVQLIVVTLEGTFADAAGGSTVQPGVSISLSSATVAAWVTGAVAEPDAGSVICEADGYVINPAIWNVLGPGDRGCLEAPSR